MLRKDYSGWSREDLVREIKKLEKSKGYGIVWEDKPESVAELCKEKLPVLTEDKTKAIETDGKKPVNILIEGDNYHALSVLSYTHKEKIDVIYIDPPYNTGSKDWKYNNDFVDDLDTWRHSKWLSFMEKRLKLAKHLLKRSGVLICTIDENEHAALGLLLQELFPDKEIVCVTIIHNPGGIQGNNFSYCHEYAYFVHPTGGTYISKIKRDDVAPMPLRDWGKESSKREAARTCFYPIFVKDEKVIGFGDVCPEDFHPKKSNILQKDGSIAIYPVDSNGVERKWRFSRLSVDEIKEELICQTIKNELVIVRGKTDYRWKTVWTDTKYNANVYGTKLLNSIIRAKFPFPKSLYAVMDCVKAVIHDKNNSIVLDFFAGSGTTGHAVMMLNKQDKGNRRFILCTNNENRIADEICYPRVKRVIEGHRDHPDITKIDANLRYYRTEFVDAAPTDRNKKRLVDKSTEMLCLKEDCHDLLKKGDGFRIYGNLTGKLLSIVYDDDAIGACRREIKKMNKKFIVYVFSLDESAREEEFEDLETLVELKPIPAVIMNVYKRIFK